MAESGKAERDWGLRLYLGALLLYVVWFVIRAGIGGLGSDADRCVRLINTRQEVCVRVGGLIDVGEDGETVCVIRAMTPP